MSNVRRLRVLFVAVASLGLSVSPPPVAAATAGVIVFQGEASLSGALSYPCVGTATLSVAKCPTPVTSTTAPFVEFTGANTRGFAFGASVCITSGVSSSSTPTDALLDEGLCSIWASGTITGSCGLSSGIMHFSIQRNLLSVSVFGLSNRTTHLTGTLRFVTVAHYVVLVGTIDGAPSVSLVGRFTETAIPERPIFGLPIDNSCLAKTATHITIHGELAFAAT